MAKNIKEVHPSALVCYKVGAFVNCYGKDAYILSFLFNYKIKIIDNNNIVSGFPKNALPKLTERLQREKIDYIIIDTKNNYDVDEKEKYNNLNRYDEIMEKAQKNTKLKVRIQKISDYLFKKKVLIVGVNIGTMNVMLKSFGKDDDKQRRNLEEFIKNRL